MKTAIIFGHTSGLGLEVSRILLSKGLRVIGFARSESSIQSKHLINIHVDLSLKEDINKTIALIKNNYSVFDYFIYCSGMLTAHSVDNLNYEDLEYLYKVNLFAPMTIESAILPLVKKNQADILNVTSSSIIEYYPKYAEYSSSKTAFHKFTQDLQKECSDTASRVIEFCPGGFASNIYKSMTGDKITRDESIQMNPSDVASVLVCTLELPKKLEVSYIYLDRK